MWVIIIIIIITSVLLNVYGQGEGTGVEIGSEGLQDSAEQERTQDGGLQSGADDERKSRHDSSSSSSSSTSGHADRSYDHPDTVEAAAARLRAQQPSVYERLGVEELYSRVNKNH